MVPRRPAPPPRDGEERVQISPPPVEEGLYDLRADGIARQVVDSIEVVSPERGKKEVFVFFEGVPLVVTGCVLITGLRSVGGKACRAGLKKGAGTARKRRRQRQKSPRSERKPRGAGLTAGSPRRGSAA